MDLQTGLSRALLLLLFLHLMPLGRSHPLGGPSPAPHSELSGAQEPPDHLPGTGGKSQEEQAAPEPPQQGRGSKAVGETRRAASAAGLGPRDVLRGPKRMRDLGCFGGRMDRIGSFTGLGCNVLKRP
ncbi:unnamed protein product [Pipistrellus nathusii]|uniref:Natriuretic peptides B n=1 Tax=Pipistrellus nathusii TaxID=59473 RepID=A0ABN9ZUJ0_PIPNA